ncbi:hypothetical protein N656DRAFT_707225 [Canariomyces notabilis]|uniref:Pentatricopeptide repeat-containing protein n=1 Tax=Canariomyces notabilis TaxID=2074819 RepID=A0AAN6YTY9_9PEZI|nr:hypothetical protein N656DRAFT_707225 [Canariomyces arenarius]
MWPSVMLACLKECPARAIELLHATVEPGVTPPYAVADVLGFIVRWMTIRQGEIDPALESQLPPLLLRILSCSPPQSFEFKQWIIHRVITSCHDTQTLATLYSELRRYGHFLSKWTRLHIASRLGKDLRYKSAAFRILDEIAEKREMDLNGPAFASVVTSLLTFPLAEEDDSRTSLRQPQRLRELEQLLFEGVHSWKDFSPNLITLTTLMQGFCHNKDYAGAWAVHDLMRNQGIEPNAYVYSILLSGSKWAGSFRSGDRVISDAPADVLRNPVILNDLLHFMLLSAERETRRRTPFVRVFPAMLLVYIRFFKLEPLQKLYPSDLTRWLTDENLGEEWDWMGKMAPIINKLPVLGPQERLDPKADTLRIMTLGYISSLTDPYGVIAFYSRFCSLLRAGDEHALALIKLGSRVHDLIIKALTRFEGMLRVAISILEDMLKDTAARKAASTTATDRITPIADQQPQQGMNADLPIHPEPRDTTWNIILDAFCRNPNENLKSQLERVLQMMQRHGVKANKITWTLLTFAYANWQNPALVAKTYSEMVGAGYDADEYVDRAFARLNNRTTAITMLERNPPQEAPPTLDDVMLREELLETRKMLEERRARRLARDSDAVAEAMEQLQMQQNQIEEQRERDAAEAGWGRWDHDGEEAELGSAMPQPWDEEVERERSGQLDEASTAVDELGPTLPGDTVDRERETRVRNDSTVRS